MIRIPISYIENLSAWRRDFHRYPEPGWLEFRTTAKIADCLAVWGYDVFVGRDIEMGERLGVPSKEEIHLFYERAQKLGANEKWLAKMEGGYTGAIAVLDTGIPGPTVAFRIDIDALPILESKENQHFPQQQGFRSEYDGFMHACGHDSHASMGLGLAEQIMVHRDKLKGKVIMIFQPAEEGVRGAAALVASPLLNDVDYFFALHIGTGVEKGVFIAGTDGFFATSKYDVTVSGLAAHAGAYPERGKNALLASAQAAIALHALPPHSGGANRINVGTLQAGVGRNIIPSIAHMQLELRGETTEIVHYYEEKMHDVFEGIAKMYDVEVSYQKVGSAISVPSDKPLAEVLAKTAKELNVQCIDYQTFNAGSEDATFLMKKVQDCGGQATYSIMGTHLPAGHHHECFDIDEEDMLPAIEIWINTLISLSKETSK
jgi:aminobenzoyl-glutamate utilization protein A